MPADMPWVRPDTIRRIADAPPDAPIVVPVFQPDGAPAPVDGHPVRFSAALLPELAALGGDRGARVLFARHPVRRLPVTDPGIVRDVDTPADLADEGRPDEPV